MSEARPTSVTVYSAADGTPDALAGDTVAVLGYGNLGRTAALNLRDSRLKVLIGNREDDYAVRARAEGFEVRSLAQAAAADIVYVLLPDEVIPDAFSKDVAPALRPGGALAFASGYSLAYGLIHPPDTVDVLLVAPRMGGAPARASRRDARRRRGGARSLRRADGRAPARLGDHGGVLGRPRGRPPARGAGDGDVHVG